MSEQPINQADQSLRMNQVLGEYIRRRDAGEAINLEEFCSLHPDLAESILRFAKGEEHLNLFAAQRSQEQIDSDVSWSTETFRAGTGQTFEFSPDTEFGRYRIQRTLGAGAMGSISLAEDTHLGRNVALKIPKLSGHENQEFQQRFTREARAAAKLDHPNLCRVYDAGEIDGTPFITMEFIDGQTLSQLIQSGGLRDQRRVAEIVCAIASGLEEAHQHGILHRDLKPGNVLLKRGTVPCVTDFGLACLVESDQTSRLTHEGTILGTPAYMSPEQVEGKSSGIGPRSDIYSLGVILYELLTSRIPFQGSVLSVLGQVMRDPPPPPTQFRHDIDPVLAGLCLQMLAKAADDRPASMQEVVDRLQQWLNTVPVQSTRIVISNPADKSEQQSKLLRAPKRYRNHWKRLTAIGLLFALFGGMYGVLILLKDGERMLAVEVDEEWLKSLGGALSLSVDGKEYSLKGPELDIKVSLGPHGFSVKNAGALIHNPQTFTIEKEGRQVLSINSTGMDFSEESAPRKQLAVASRSEAAPTNPTPSLSPAPQSASPTKPAQTTSIGEWQPTPEQQAFFDHVARLPAEDQITAVVRKLQEINPGYDGQVESKIDNGRPYVLVVQSAEVSEIWPIRGLATLKYLGCSGSSRNKKSRLKNTAPLAGLSLQGVSLNYCEVSDLSPLAGMPCDTVSFAATPVRDLRPLKGMKLVAIECSDTLVSDLSPLTNAPLTSTYLGNTPVSDLRPLAGKNLKELNFSFRYFDAEAKAAVRDLNIQSIRFHQTGSFISVSEFWDFVASYRKEINEFATRTAALSPEKQIAAITDKLQALDSQYQFHANFEGENITEASIHVPAKPMATIGPLRSLKNLKKLSVTGGPTAFDLSPINLAPLIELNCREEHILFNSSVLMAMSTLKLINGQPAKEHLKSLRETGAPPSASRPLSTSGHWQPTPEQQVFFDHVATLPAEEQIRSVITKLMTVNPLYDGQMNYRSDAGVVTDLSISSSKISEIWPIRALKGLVNLDCAHYVGSQWERKGLITDLAPLTGLNLKTLSLSNTCASDLSPLAGMQLESLNITRTYVSDLSPLKGMKLTVLRAAETSISNLLPLEGMSFTTLEIDHTPVADFRPFSKIAVRESLSLSLPLFHFRDQELIAGLSVATLSTTGKERKPPQKEFWEAWQARQDTVEALADKIENLPANEQTTFVLSSLKAGAGKEEISFEPVIQDNKIVEAIVTLGGWGDDQLESLRGLTSLRKLTIYGGANGLDLSPLNTLPLESLICSRHLAFRNAPILLSISSLRTVNTHPAQSYLSELTPGPPIRMPRSLISTDGNVPVKWNPTSEQLQFIDDVQKLSAQQQVEAVASKLCEVNPDFCRPVKFQIVGGSVSELEVPGFNITELWPIRGLAQLQSLGISGVTWDRRSRLWDLSPLTGLRLTSLHFEFSNVSNLDALAGMPLVKLHCYDTFVNDLKPLSAAPLQSLGIEQTLVADISPVAQSAMTALFFRYSLVSDLRPLEKMSLQNVTANVSLFDKHTEVALRNLSPELINYQPANAADVGFWKEFSVKQQQTDDIARQTTLLSPQDQIDKINSHLQQNASPNSAILSWIADEGSIIAIEVRVHGGELGHVAPLRTLSRLQRLTILNGPLGLDLSPINIAPLEELNCSEAHVLRNASMLSQIPTLKLINGYPAKEHLKRLR